MTKKSECTLHEWLRQPEYSHELAVDRAKCSYCGCWAWRSCGPGQSLTYKVYRSKGQLVFEPDERWVKRYGRAAKPERADRRRGGDPSSIDSYENRIPTARWPRG